MQPATEALYYKQKEAETQKSTEVRKRILTEFSRWKGVRYKLGGTSDSGIDCSALMQQIFDSALAMPLPRTTSEQIKKGLPVSIDQLKPGDLVFFQTKQTTRHVGVYVGKHMFVHASSSKGVTASSIESPYWSERFEDARRFLS